MSIETERRSAIPAAGAPPPMIPGVRNPADLSAFVLERTLSVERSVRRRRMVLLVLSLVTVFVTAVGLLVAGIVEQGDQTATPHPIAMYGLDDAGRFVLSPLVMRQETERTDMKVARRLTRVDGTRPVLSATVLEFLEARGGGTAP